jgi:hypothetical protein|tara:strand:+ start:819 stop:1151 length:333 start_codon:yes stop_codon:yes gene_type:complete
MLQITKGDDMSQEIEKVITEEELHRNPLLAMITSPDEESELKTFMVDYAGSKLGHEEVTVSMIAEVLAAEFPEFVFAVAEENFLRGYQLGLDDAYKTITGKPEETTAAKL